MSPVRFFFPFAVVVLLAACEPTAPSPEAAAPDAGSGTDGQAAAPDAGASDADAPGGAAETDGHGGSVVDVLADGGGTADAGVDGDGVAHPDADGSGTVDVALVDGGVVDADAAHDVAEDVKGWDGNADTSDVDDGGSDTVDGGGGLDGTGDSNDGEGLPDVHPDTVDASDATTDSAGTADAEADAEADGDADADADTDADADADATTTTTPLGEPIPDFPLVPVNGFQGGLYGCDEDVELPAPADVPGPCYQLDGIPGDPPESLGVTRYGYDCKMRKVFESGAWGTQASPYIYELRSYTALGFIDEFGYDRTDIEGASYVKKHHYDGAGRLEQVEYAYPKGWTKSDPTAREEYTYSIEGHVAIKDTYVFDTTLTTQSLGTSEHYSYSPQGNLVQTDVYDSEGFLNSRTTQKWEGTHVIEVEEDYGTNCMPSDDPSFPVHPWCPKPGADGLPESRIVYMYNGAGQLTREEFYWVWSNGEVDQWALYVYEYQEDGKLWAKVGYPHYLLEAIGEIFALDAYEYDSHGRELRYGWWNKPPQGWWKVFVNSYDCWSAP